MEDKNHHNFEIVIEALVCFLRSLRSEKNYASTVLSDR